LGRIAAENNVGSIIVRLAWNKYLPGFIGRRIEANPQLRDIIGNTGWMMGDRIVRAGVGLLVGIWLARYLGPELFGHFSYAFAFAMIFAPLAMLALDEIAIRRLVEDPSCRDEVLGTSFALMAAAGIVAFLVAMMVIYLVRPGDSLAHWLVGIMVAGAIAQSLIAIEFWFESQLQWKFTVYAKNSVFLFMSLIKVGLILLQAPLVAFAWAGLAETVIGGVGLLIVYRLNGFRIGAWRFRRSLAGSLLKDSWPLIFSSLMIMIYLRIDQIMLGNMAGSQALGIYSAAVRISEAWFFIPIAICSSVFPAVMKAMSSSEELYYEHLQKLYNLMVVITYLIAIPVTFFSGEIINVLFASGYAPAGPLLTILIWTGLFTSLGAARNIFIISKNWTRINLISTSLGCITNILLNYFLIPRYGAMGAVIATFISYWFAVHGTCLLIRPLRRTGWMMTKAIFYPKIW
jgi:O-antigen/teichoic acid export membrane protein